MDDLAAPPQRAGSADETRVGEAPSAQRAAEPSGGGRGHVRRPGKRRRNAFSSAPTATANGNTNAAMARPVRQPRSFTIIKKFATQGMNSVTVVTATTTWTGSRRPARA